MIATLAAFAALIQQPVQTDPNVDAAASLISKMLAHYYKAKKLSGSILLTTTAGKVSGKLLTTVQFDDPSKLYIRQDLQAESQGTWMIVSDGNLFSYPLPATQLGEAKTLVERVFDNGELRSFRDIYAIGASGLKDRSAPLDIAIGRFEDLKFFKGHLATYTLGQPEDVRGKSCQVVQGGWRVSPKAVVAESRYRIWITDSGELMRYEITDNIESPTSPGTMVQVRQVWDVDFHLDGQTVPGLYRVG